MKLWKIVTVTLVSLIGFATLPGCSGPFAVHPDTTTATPVQKAQYSVDQVNAVITAAATSLADNVTSGAVDKVTAKNIADRLHQAAGYVDQAEAAVKAGNAAGANSNIALANGIVSAVQSELLKLQKEGK